MNKKTFHMNDIETETRTIKMHYDIFESTMISVLYALGAINDDTDVVGADFGIDVDDRDMIEFDIEVVVPRGKRVGWEPKIVEG
jgi:hypothetical protein